MIAVATCAALFGPLLAPYSPVLTNLSLAWVGPDGGHLLGFDGQGRDVLSGCWPARPPRCSARWRWW